MGKNKTLAMLGRRFYWRNMARDVEGYIKGCVKCQKRKATRPLRQGLLTPMLAPRPFHTVAVDFVGPFEESSIEGHRYILVMVDTFTRWPIAVPLQSREAHLVAEALTTHLITVHGIPHRILTDQGAEFIGKGVKHMCRNLGIKKIQTSGWQPQANGHVERFNRYLGAALAINVGQRKRAWAAYIPAVLFAYRVSVNATTGCSPFYLVYGREPTLPADHAFSNPERAFDDEVSYGIHTTENLVHAFGKVREAQMRMAAYNKNRIDQGRYETTFVPGDAVLLYEPSQAEGRKAGRGGSKLTPSFTGPHTVVRRRGDVNYVVRHATRGTEETFHVNAMRLYLPWEDWTPAEPPDGILRDLPQPTVTKTTIEVGDLVIVRKEGNNGEGLRVAKVMRVPRGRKRGYAVQWCGNHAGAVFGSHLPGWLDFRGVVYYKREPNNKDHKPYTDEVTLETVQVSDICPYAVGFALSSRSKIPGDIIERVAADPKAKFEMPDL